MSVKSEKKRFMLACGILALLIIILAGYGLTAVKKPSRPSVAASMETAANKDIIGRALPEITFFDEKGDSVQLDDFSGRVILVNLWATWCAPCVAELPALDNLQMKMKDRNFDIVAISMDRDDMGKVRQFLADRKIENITAYWDRDRDIQTKWRFAGLPVSYLIDENGKVIEQFDGPREWAHEDMVKKISDSVK